MQFSVILCYLVDKMIAGGTTNRRVSSGATDNLTALMKRPWEATVALTSFQRPVSLQTKGFFTFIYVTLQQEQKNKLPLY